MTHRILRAALFISFLAGCDTNPKSPPARETTHPITALTAEAPPASAADLLESYNKLRLMTPMPVYVDRGLAELCRGANQTDVQRAQKTNGPHAYSTIQIFMNPTAADAFPKAMGGYPVGATIVKEKSPLSYRDDNGKSIERPAAVGGMIKRAPGYDPKHGDWEYFYAEKGAKLESGRIDSCRDCHGNASTKDYVFGGWASPTRKQ